MKPFPCVSCGSCCRHVDLSEETRFLDRGDGVCRDYDNEAQLCWIYETRPMICRVDRQYAARFAGKMSWEAFCEINLQACSALQKMERLRKDLDDGPETP